METSFAVGAIFKIVNEASPTLRALLKQVRELRVEIDKTKASMAELTKGISPVGMSAAIDETNALASAWGRVATDAKAARTAIGNAAAAARGAAIPAAGAGGRGRLGGRLGMGGGGHLGGPGVGLPGGSHLRFNGGAAAAAGLVGYGAYEAAEMEDAVFQLMYHAGVEYNDSNRSKFRKILQDSMVKSGYGLRDISEAATQNVRMFQGVPGSGVDVLPEMLRAATTEARLKGSSPKESMQALIGLAHMTKEYDPEAIKKLAKDFAFLSISNPSSLTTMERAAGYAVPILQSGLNVDPMDSLLLGTALTRAGITNTKSGTWLREMAVRAMPGTAIFESEKKAEKHDELLKKIGLLDEHGKATWLTNGHADVLKMLDIAGPRLAALPMEERVRAERLLFGAQGSGAVSVLSDKAVHDQIAELNRMRKSPEFANRYSGFSEQYLANSTVQQARTAMQEFNVTMMDLGAHVLPSVTGALKEFKGLIEAVKGVLPGPPKKDGDDSKKWGVGTTALEGAGVGAIAGSFMPGIGTAAGAIIGGATGAAAAAVHDGVGSLLSGALEKGERPGDRYERRVEQLKLQQKAPTVHLNINLDGKAIAQAVSEQHAEDSQYSTSSPAFDPSQLYGP